MYRILIFLTLMCCTIEKSSAQIISDNLQAAYPFSGDANDSLGGTDGVVLGAVLGNGFLGDTDGAYEFSGNDDNQIIEINDSIIDQTADFTIQFWVNIDSLYTADVQTNYMVLSRHGADGSPQGGVEFSYGDDSIIRFILREVTSPPLATAVSTVPYTDDWFSITGTKEGDTIRLYMNGLFIDSDVMSSSVNHATSDFWTVGASYLPGPTLYREMDGSVDDILFYDKRLTDCEIYHLYERHPYSIETEVLSDYNGYGVSCFGSTDGSAAVEFVNSVDPISYTWSHGETNDTTLNVAAGTYEIITEDAVGCIDTAEVVITSPDSLTDTVLTSLYPSGHEISCNGLSDGFIDLDIMGGAAPYSYNWIPTGDFTEDISSIPAGSYLVDVMDANGCSHSVNVTLTEPSAMSVSASSTPELFGDDGEIDLTVSGGSPSYTYDWDNDITGDFDDSEDLSGLAGGVYQVIVKDTNGCVDTTSVEVQSQLSINESDRESRIFVDLLNQNLILSEFNEISALSIYSLNGQLVLNQKDQVEEVIGLSHLERGVYVVQLKFASGSVRKKIVLQ